jgi:cobalt transporter subunit CbtA
VPLIFSRLIWSSLAVALAVGTVQTGVQRWQAAPLILAAEAYEGQKVQNPVVVSTPLLASVTAPALAAAPHTHAPSASAHEHPQTAVQQQVQATETEHDHDHGVANAWAPENGAQRIGWTWVANALHAFSMALLVFAVMGVWRYRRGSALAALPLAGFVAAAGWLSFYLWPTLGLPPELPGMDAAPLQDRQLWSVLTIANAAAACALVGFGKAKWRWPLATVLLAFPFILGAPHLQGDAFAGYSSEAHAALAQLVQQFSWATTWVALSFWLSLGLACGLAFQRWLQPMLMDSFAGAGLVAT